MDVETNAIRTAQASPEVLALCDALDTARAALASAQGDLTRVGKRLEFAQTARQSAEVERTKLQTAVSAGRAACHRTLAAEGVDPDTRDLAERVLAALAALADRP